MDETTRRPGATGEGPGTVRREPPQAHRPDGPRARACRAGPVRIVAVGGKRDHDSADGLRTALAGPGERGPDRILVDLAERGFCDSTGLNVLLRARQEAERAGVRPELAGPRPAVVRHFAVTGADSVLRVHPGVALVPRPGGGPAGPPDPAGT
ncbi:STAS domain-containing protein [Kitasatospora sp. NPDC058032]|uniref:STAS domain-containing protein n=1 Tax=Kitasatospora sp. NPDC058032 TaxID=3346307 RepID=UPI0036DB608A